MWCSELSLAALPFARNINPSLLISFQDLGNELTSDPAIPTAPGRAVPSPSQDSEPSLGLCHHSLLGFGPFQPSLVPLERDALLTLRGQPHFPFPQHPLPQSGTGCCALCRSMPASGCFLVTTGPGKSHWLLVIVFATIKQ